MKNEATDCRLLCVCPLFPVAQLWLQIFRFPSIYSQVSQSTAGLLACLVN